MITPSIVSKDGVKTPLNVPNFFWVDINSSDRMNKYAKNELIFL